MTQDVFSSVYTKDYRWFQNVDRPSPAKGINIAEDPKKYEKFLSPQELKPGQESADAIQNLHRLWWKTIYRVDFCEERFPKSEAAADPLKEDVLMDSLERVFNPPQRKLLPPPDTTGVVHGFCPMRDFRSRRSLYTDMHSKHAFEQLKRLVLERGMCRLAAPPVEYPEPDPTTPPCRKGKAPPPRTWIHLRPDPYS